MGLSTAWGTGGDAASRRRRYADAVRSAVGGELGAFGEAVVMEDIPEEFFFAAASSSGNHHPAFDLGDGGLVRHSLIVASVAAELVRPYGIPGSAGTVVLASLLHDGWKGVASPGGGWQPRTQDNHGTVGGLSVRAAAARLGFGGADLVAECVRTHPSAWYDIGIPIHRLPTPEQQVVASADYLASRKRLQGWSLD